MRTQSMNREQNKSRTTGRRRTGAAIRGKGRALPTRRAPARGQEKQPRLRRPRTESGAERTRPKGQEGKQEAAAPRPAAHVTASPPVSASPHRPPAPRLEPPEVGSGALSGGGPPSPCALLLHAPQPAGLHGEENQSPPAIRQGTGSVLIIGARQEAHQDSLRDLHSAPNSDVRRTGPLPLPLAPAGPLPLTRTAHFRSAGACVSRDAGVRAGGRVLHEEGFRSDTQFSVVSACWHLLGAWCPQHSGLPVATPGIPLLAWI